MNPQIFPVPTREPLTELVKTTVRHLPLPVEFQEKLLFYGKLGYWPDFDDPKTYNEKINWRKFHSTNELYVRCSDKLACREHVREKLGEEFLIPILFSGDFLTEKELIALGDNVVVKGNHDSGSVCLIRENTPERAAEVCAKVNQRVSINFGEVTNEWWYAKIPRKVCVERMLETEDGGVPNDFKFFVFRQPEPQPPKVLIEVDFGRGTPDHHRSFYDADRNLVDWVDGDVTIDGTPNHRTPFPDIGNYDEMLRAALALAEDFDHVRVDMYSVKDRVYFGEMTFSEGGGRSRWGPPEFDRVLGDYWSLDREPGGAERPGRIEVQPQEFERNKKTKGLYRRLRGFGERTLEGISGAFERTIRFFAIPYALICLIDWNECKRNPVLVFWDHLYLFFKLGYFPDNYAVCRLWEVPRKDWVYYYGAGYDPRSIRRRNKQVRRGECAVLFEDKEVCYQLCQSYGLPLPIQYGVIDPRDDFAARMQSILEQEEGERLMIKRIDGCGGKDACLVERNDTGEIIARRICNPLKAIPLVDFQLRARSVIQECVHQHPVVSGLSGRALNTIRTVTMMTPDDEVIVLGAYIRVGAGSNFVDSGSHGGIGVKIDIETGRLGERTTDGMGRFVEVLPDAYDAVSEVTLPYWSELLEMAKETQRRFAPFNKFLGMDIGMSENGPVLVEINDIFDCARFESVTGPILKNEAVLEACRSYGLLTHRHLG